MVVKCRIREEADPLLLPGGHSPGLGPVGELGAQGTGGWVLQGSIALTRVPHLPSPGLEVVVNLSPSPAPVT